MRNAHPLRMWCRINAHCCDTGNVGLHIYDFRLFKHSVKCASNYIIHTLFVFNFSSVASDFLSLVISRLTKQLSDFCILWIIHIHNVRISEEHQRVSLLDESHRFLFSCSFKMHNENVAFFPWIHLNCFIKWHANLLLFSSECVFSVAVCYCPC